MESTELSYQEMNARKAWTMIIMGFTISKSLLFLYSSRNGTCMWKFSSKRLQQGFAPRKNCHGPTFKTKCAGKKLVACLHRRRESNRILDKEGAMRCLRCFKQTPGALRSSTDNFIILKNKILRPLLPSSAELHERSLRHFLVTWHG